MTLCVEYGGGGSYGGRSSTGFGSRSSTGYGGRSSTGFGGRSSIGSSSGSGVSSYFSTSSYFPVWINPS